MSDALSLLQPPDPGLGDGMGRLVAKALVLAHAAGPEVDQELRAVISQLEQDPDRALAELRRRSDAADPDDIGLRWTLLYVTNMLREPRGMQWLVDVACEALPADPAAAEACESRTDSEVLVRVMGTEAIVGLLGVEPDAAAEALLNVIEQQPNVAIRAVAGQALIEHDPSLRDPLLGLLPTDQQFIVDLRRVPHTDLAVEREALPGGPAHAPDPAPSPDGTGEAPGDPSGSAPTVSGASPAGGGEGG